MKKLLAIALVLMLALTSLAGCAPKVIKGVDGTRVEVQGDTVSVQHHSDSDACIIIYGKSLGY